MFNKLVEKEIQDPYVYGILVQGYDLTTYRMDVSGRYVYRFVHLETCSVCQSIEQLP